MPVASSWRRAYTYALDNARSSGYRYRVCADRARRGLWLVYAIPGSAGHTRASQR